MLAAFPPEAEWDYVSGWAKAFQESRAAEIVADGSDIVGLHATDTIDLVTIVSGEIYAITESGETLMKPGDSLVQRGTKHAWSNRDDTSCTMVAVHVAAVR